MATTTSTPRVAYIVSRFPHASETFIVRELDALRAQGVELELRSLFAPVPGAVHPRARPWMSELRRPDARTGVAALAGWALRRPLRLAATLGAICRGYGRNPSRLVRALATLPLAAAHARELERTSVAHVHAHYATYPALAAWVVWRLTGIPYSFTAHAHDLYVDQSLLARKLADARFAVAISEFNRRFLARYGSDAVTPVHVVHCGVEPAAYPFEPRQPAAEGPVAALCVASLQEYKGHRYLLEALARGNQPRGAAGEAGTEEGRAGDALQRIQLELVGDGELRERLEALVAELGLDGRVCFRGSLPEPEVAALLERADLFVLPSVVAGDGQMEGLPVALIEALACGLPAVSTRLSGIPELIRDGETGVLAEPADAADLARVLARLLAGSPELDLGAGRQLVEREFDVDRSAARLRELFTQG
jgi:colanic acid/amylovoran biosynthesis glycosyltransferase